MLNVSAVWKNFLGTRNRMRRNCKIVRVSRYQGLYRETSSWHARPRKGSCRCSRRSTGSIRRSPWNAATRECWPSWCSNRTHGCSDGASRRTSRSNGSSWSFSAAGAEMRHVSDGSFRRIATRSLACSSGQTSPTFHWRCPVDRCWITRVHLPEYWCQNHALCWWCLLTRLILHNMIIHSFIFKNSKLCQTIYVVWVRCLNHYNFQKWADQVYRISSLEGIMLTCY